MPVTFHHPLPSSTPHNVIWKSGKILFKPDLMMGSEVKSIGGKKVQGNWLLPPIWASIKGLQRLYGDASLSYDPDIQRLFFSSPSGWEVRPFSSLSSAVPRWEDFREYQREAIQFLTSSPYPGAMLSLSPGLGKTPVSIQSAIALRNLGVKMDRVLVVTLLSLIGTWKGELETWAPGEDVFLAYQEGPPDPPPLWTITNWETLVSKKKAFSIPWDLVILDESILVKSGGLKRTSSSLRWKAAREVRRKATRVWALSGSPTSRYADDLWAQFELLYPGVFTSYWRFAETYCHIQVTPWGNQVTGTRRNIDFLDEFKDLKFTRDRKEVLDLPEIFFETIYVDLSPEQRGVYDQIKKDFIAELAGVDTLEVTTKMSQLTRLLQVTSNTRNLGPEWPDLSSKLDKVIELLIQDYFPLPAIIWTHWVPGAESAYERLSSLFPGEVGYLSAQTKNRQEIVSQFQMGRLKLLVISLGVGKYGFTLTRAQSAIYLDKSWDGDAYYQSLSRIPRFGLDHTATIYSIVANKTVDSHVKKNLGKKSVSFAKISNADLINLLRSLE